MPLRGHPGQEGPHRDGEAPSIRDNWRSQGSHRGLSETQRRNSKEGPGGVRFPAPAHLFGWVMQPGDGPQPGCPSLRLSWDAWLESSSSYAPESDCLHAGSPRFYPLPSHHPSEKLPSKESEGASLGQLLAWWTRKLGVMAARGKALCSGRAGAGLPLGGCPHTGLSPALPPWAAGHWRQKEGGPLSRAERIQVLGRQCRGSSLGGEGHGGDGAQRPARLRGNNDFFLQKLLEAYSGEKKKKKSVMKPTF